jgi:hypothetical protein
MFLFDPWYQVEDSAGLPRSGAKLFFYATGTTTPITVYQDVDGVAAHASPVVADASGIFAPIYINTTGKFKTVLKTSADVVIQTVDPHQGFNAGSISDLGGVVTVAGSANAIQITSSAKYLSLASGIRLLFKPSADNTSTTVTLALDGLTAKNVRRRSGAGTSDVAVLVGDLQQTQEAEVLYDTAADSGSGGWILLNPRVDRLGTQTNNSPTTGMVGEYVESIVLAGAAVSLTTNTAADVTSISLTAGDWDVSGVVWFTRDTTTSTTVVRAWVNSTATTLPTAPGDGGLTTYSRAAFTTSTTEAMVIGLRRFSLASTTTSYLGTQCTFTVSTTTAYGIERARRVR